jgi:GNAT superfamily N-acetyltransferase
VDSDAVWQFLSAEAYWSRWRSRDDVQRQIQGAWRVVGCCDGQGHMVGFARALSDGVALAYLADVYVLENHRGRGLGRALLKEMIKHGPGKEFRWLLHTADAHGLYRQFGFTAPDATIMERTSRRPTATNPAGAKPLVPRLLGQSRRAWGVRQGADLSRYQGGSQLTHRQM